MPQLRMKEDSSFVALISAEMRLYQLGLFYSLYSRVRLLKAPL